MDLHPNGSRVRRTRFSCPSSASWPAVGSHRPLRIGVGIAFAPRSSLGHTMKTGRFSYGFITRVQGEETGEELGGEGYDACAIGGASAVGVAQWDPEPYNHKRVHSVCVCYCGRRRACVSKNSQRPVDRVTIHSEPPCDRCRLSCVASCRPRNDSQHGSQVIWRNPPSRKIWSSRT